MSNPYLPKNEYIPDGEPRVFGDRIYVYGSHDRANSNKFCDYKLKVWSAPLDDLNNWVCHGHAFHTMPDDDHPSDTDWTSEPNDLYAPDVVEKDGKYYLYAYIMGAKGCVAVADHPWGPFKLIGKYEYNIENMYDDGIFIDPGVLVDDDGRVYCYCGFQGSYMVELNPDKMNEVIDGTYMEKIIPVEAPHYFFEACSPRKIGNTYYMIYSPCHNVLEDEGGGSRLCYATSDSPRGPFTYRGTIIDNGKDYPGGNNHGSIMKIKDQWYIFYHRMTNGTIMSRRGCVEKINILPDGTIPTVEMTSLGFENALNPYNATDADIACVLKNGCLIIEKNMFTRVITNIKDNAIIGYKYYDFGVDEASKTMELHINTIGRGMNSKIHVFVDSYCEINDEADLSSNPNYLGYVDIGPDDGVYSSRIKAITGNHALYFVIKKNFGGWFDDMTNGRELCEIKEFVFTKN